MGADKTDLPYIAAITSLTPGGVFVRTDSNVAANGTARGNDALFYSGDGGSTWTMLLRKSAKLLGFALSPDGAKVLAGYGNDDTATSADPSQVGVFEANANEGVFSLVLAGQPVTCLTWTATGTYVCTPPADIERLRAGGLLSGWNVRGGRIGLASLALP